MTEEEDREKGEGEGNPAFPVVEREEDGALLLRGLPQGIAAVLLELPDILKQGEEEDLRSVLHSRVYPDEPEREEEWNKLMGGELFHLFADRARILGRDLEGMTIDSSPRRYRVRIPGKHLTAWISSLAAARLILAERFEVDEEAMRKERDFEEPGIQDLVIWRIDVLALIQEMLLLSGEAEGGE